MRGNNPMATTEPQPRRLARGTDGPIVPVLAVDRLTLRRSDNRMVVDDLSFTVDPGEVVALAGALGSGRSATLSALFGIARGELSGSVRVDGKPVRLRTPADAIEAGMAFVPEDRKAQGLVLGLSAADNVALSSLGRTCRAGDDQAALSRLRDLTIRVSGSKVPGLGAEVATFSSGNHQRVVIGRWLDLPPRVLLLDEPTRGVDAVAKAEIYALIEELTASGHAVVLASSDLSEVVELADRVLVLRDGKLAGTLDGAAISQLAIMQLAVGTVGAALAHDAMIDIVSKGKRP